jgi:hypothetical protein
VEHSVLCNSKHMFDLCCVVIDRDNTMSAGVNERLGELMLVSVLASLGLAVIQAPTHFC